MKLRLSSSGCEARPAKGEPARAGSEPGDGLGNETGEAQAREPGRVADCGRLDPESAYALPGSRSSTTPAGPRSPIMHVARRRKK